MSPQRYDGKLAVITGASSGIGRALALELAQRGATVIGLARRQSLLDELAAELSELSELGSTAVCDVAHVSTFSEHLAGIEAEHGHIDVLVNNAGVDLERDRRSGDEALIRTIFDVNFFAVVAGTLAVLPGMKDRGQGIVVNVSSDSARAPEPGQAGYASSKAAVSAFTDALAHEVASTGVRLHILYPGWVPTAMGLGEGEVNKLPPKMVRRTADGVAKMVADRMGGPVVDLNAARLPLLAPIMRTVAPRTYQRSMRSFTGPDSSHPAC